MNPVWCTLAAIISNIARRPIQSVTPGCRFNDLGIDHFKYIEILLKCDEIFSITIPDDESEFVSTPGELASLIFRHMKARAA